MSDKFLSINIENSTGSANDNNPAKQLSSDKLISEKWKIILLTSGYLMSIISLYLCHSFINVFSQIMGRMNITMPYVSQYAILILDSPLKLFLLIACLTLALVFLYRHISKNNYINSIFTMVFFSQSSVMLIMSFLLVAAMIPWLYEMIPY